MRKKSSFSEKMNKGNGGVAQLKKFRFWQILFYSLGFPLTILLVAVNSSEFLGKAGFENTSKNAILIVFAIWAIVSLIQVVYNHFQKGFTSRAIFIVAITLVCMIGTALILESSAKSDINKASEYAKTNNLSANIPSAKRQYDWFKLYTKGGAGYAKNYSGSISQYGKTYNSGISSSAIRAHQNSDGSVAGQGKYYGNDKKSQETIKKELGAIGIQLKKGKNDVNYFFNGEATYNVDNKKKNISNGMYTEGFVFGLQQVHDIVKIDRDVREYYASKGENADAVLSAAITDVSANSEEYKNYMNTKGKSLKAAQEGKYEIDKVKVKGIIEALTTVLGETIKEENAQLNLITTIVGLIGVGDLDGAQKLLDKLGVNLQIETLLKEKLGSISFYNLPSVKPIYMFLPNENLGDTGISLREYALAQYYGRQHGAAIGSVILPNADGRIGQITMDTQGVLALENAMSVEALEQLMVDSSYMPKAYPKLLARRLLLVMSGFVTLFMLISTYFGVRSKQELELLEAKTRKVE